MYLEFFRLRDFPFRLSPDTDFFYLSKAHARAKAYLDYGVWNRDSFTVITGDVGCGKTLLIQKLLADLAGSSVLVAKVFQTQLDEVQFLQAVLVDFGINPFNAQKVELLDKLNTFLIENFIALRQPVLIVDDAHNLSLPVLEEIRLLSGLETQKEKVLHVILVGQPPLNVMLESPELEQLLQRVRLRYHIKPLTAEETADYIAHRLRVAGREEGGLFAPDAMPIIYKYTGGVPRLINMLCDTALVCAYAEQQPQVTAETISDAVEELQWEPYAKRQAFGGGGAKPARAAKSEKGQAAEGERILQHIGQRLNQLDTLAPTLSLISDRMATIESLLRDIAQALRDGARAESREATRHSSSSVVRPLVTEKK
jgi:type II secretory pathway predicted ATPase ExeA